MKILVIGGTRFIGAALVKELATMGHDVAILNRGQTPGNPPDGVQRITGDMNQLAAAREAVIAFAPDVTIHNMPLHPQHITDLQAIVRGVASRMVMTSSMDVYRAFGRVLGTDPGPLLPVPSDEDAPLRESRYPYRSSTTDPADRYYNYDKIPAEEAAMNDPNLPGTVLRLPMVIGPGDYRNRLFPFVRPMQDNRPAIVIDEGYARWQSTYGYIDNVAHAMALACTDERASGRIYNIGEHPAPWLELGEKVKAVMDWPGELVTAPGEKLPESLRVMMNVAQDLVCSMERITAELGYRDVVPFDEGVRRTVEWQKDNPPDPIPDDQLNYAAQDEALRNLRTD